MFKRLFIAIILLGMIVGGIVWFKFFRDEMIAQFLSGMTPAPVPVTATTVEPVTWQPGIDAVGTSLSAQGVDLAIESGGLVREIRFKANDEIAKDQVLLQIDDDSERASLSAAQAALTVAEAEANRARTLSERGVGAASTVESTVAQVASARAQVAQVQTSLDAKKLSAPFAGVIGIPRVEVGQYVTPGAIYATLQDLSRMRVDFSVPEQQIANLIMGGAVTVASEVGGYSAEGRITGIEPRVDPNSRLISVRAEVQNPNGQLVPGQFLRVRIQLPQEDGVIAVPQTAVSSSLYGDSIYVIRQGDTADELKVEQVFVTLGRRSGTRIEVIKGLASGDRIVTSGQNRLTSGAKVRIDDSVTLDDKTGN
ncbi:membrane fusion protein, multidrug efflux system [Gemmobacter megaterium]|uniref:Membrane fusion protein, multidrug efflux system n=1 Tax=Gemmobacter megaterium TaxID=1086013 RepID=A0A1N7PIA2_9RHOB|nr:efflux RND transporter periplasmic adaptor subunit [Gemmobacter megaterium]GGE18030.1 MexH family multidrug efflux RND transporter periplasmic adaptor subunit [Gemmobacter megaterium]SIT10383.1 membrane fusion protein, multidrug efflux system [Gemmobacter megaterium]